ncbi:MAG: host-nuclease inhibitor Gam family protein [Gallionella sp.]|nr:host-nuclease inhibitor Gam family protein [Gallionella sp.]
MAKPARLKTPAQIYTSQSRDDAAADIRKIGDLQRDLQRVAAEMNDAIAHITSTYQPRLEAVNEQITTLQQGVQSWCEANRDDLTNGGKVKTANLITGEIQWRQRPPSVRVSKSEVVLETLTRLGLTRFIRNKPEVNKDAILDEPDAVRGVAGISIVTGVEDFVISPFEQQVAA